MKRLIGNIQASSERVEAEALLHADPVAIADNTFADPRYDPRLVDAIVRENVRWFFTKLAMVLLLFSSTVQGQTSQERPVRNPFQIDARVDMVTVPVTVRARKGDFVKGLPRTAFHIFEDGREQEILTFEEGGAPLWIAFLLDSSASMRSEREDIITSTRWIAKQLRPRDKYSLITFDRDSHLRLGWGQHEHLLDGVFRSVEPAGQTALWDAVQNAVLGLLREVDGRRIIVVLTDGLDNSSAASLQEAIDAALRMEVSVYVISKLEAVRRVLLGNHNVWNKEFFNADQALERLARETGGRVLQMHSAEHLRQLFLDLYLELRHQYHLGYVSDSTSGRDGFRRIRVQVDQDDVVISARRGYHAQTSARSLSPQLKPKEGPVDRRATGVSAVYLGQNGLVPASRVPGEMEHFSKEPASKDSPPFVIDVPFTVRGQDGTFVQDVSSSSVSVLEVGREQRIIDLRQKEVPSRFILLIETSKQMRMELGSIRRACGRLLANLGSQDSYALVTFSGETRLKVDWSSEPEKLDVALSSIHCSGKALLWDAIWVVANDFIPEAEWKTAVVVISSGWDGGSSISRHEMLDAAIRSRASYYFVSPTPLPDPYSVPKTFDEGSTEISWQRYSKMRQSLSSLASDTGGRAVWSDPLSPNDTLLGIQQEFAHRYVLSYIPKSPVFDGGYRDIRVTVNLEDSTVRARGMVAMPERLGRIAGNPAQGSQGLLSRGTPVFLRFAETVTSKWQPGDRIQLEVYRDVQVGDLIVFARGAYAWATVASGTHKSRYFGRAGYLEVEINAADSITGEPVRLRETAVQKGLEGVIQKGSLVKALVAGDVYFNEELVQKLNEKLLDPSADLPRKSDKAVAYIYGTGYQPKMILMGRPILGKPSLYLNGEKFARVSEGHFLEIYLDPGRHTFRTDKNEFQLDLRPREVVYLRMSTGGAFWPRGFLSPVDRETGEQEVDPLDPVAPEDIRIPRGGPY